MYNDTRRNISTNHLGFRFLVHDVSFELEKAHPFPKRVNSLNHKSRRKREQIEQCHAINQLDRASRTNAHHLDEDPRKAQPPVGEDALLRLQVPQPLLEQRRLHRVPALTRARSQQTSASFPIPPDGTGEVDPKR